MSDLTDDPTLLASAYLDNEATPDERALVETSAELLAEVERLGRVRTVLGATGEPISLAAREAHLAAALDVWGRMTEIDGTGDTPAPGLDDVAAAALSTPRSSSGDRRGSKRSGLASSPWILGAAAALVLTAGVGAVFLGGRGSSDDSNTALAPADVVVDESAVTDAASRAADAEPETTSAALDDVSTAGAPESQELATEESTAAAGDFGDRTSTEAPTATPFVDSDVAPGEVEVVKLESIDDLATFASSAVFSFDGEPIPADDDWEPEAGSCEAKLGIERRVDVALYIDTLVNVGVDLEDLVAYAYNDEDCSIVARTALDR
jgi:hypothetical protein